jgi:DNA-directed RNA polymerase specialized sigma24 family protein
MSTTVMDVTELLQRWQTGDQQALNDLMPLVYTELKKLAAAHLRRERHSRPLDTTSLVHEAFLRLVSSRQPSYENR